MFFSVTRKYGLTVHGNCFMTNHLHLVATPHRKDSLAKAIGHTHLTSPRYANQLHSRSGHLWQNRFYSCLVDSAHY